MHMKRYILLLILVVASVTPLFGQEFETLPPDSYFEAFKPLKAPSTEGLLLKQGDRLAICGDLITE